MDHGHRRSYESSGPTIAGKTLEKSNTSTSIMFPPMLDAFQHKLGRPFTKYK